MFIEPFLRYCLL